MPNPKRKHSKSRRDKSRAIWKMRVASTTQCAQCGQQILPHRVCPHCGTYRGRQVVTIPAKKEARRS